MTAKPTYKELEQRVKDLEKEASEYKRFLESQFQEKDNAQKYLDIAGVIIVAIDARGEITLINKKGCETLGYSEEELIGKNWFDCCLPERMRNEVKTVFHRLLKGEIEPVEYYQNPLVDKHGEERIIAWHNTLLTDYIGNIIGTLSSGEDVTERVQTDEALRKAHDELSNFSKELEKIVQKRTEELEEKNEQLIEAEKLAALGNIANKVAHDLRNPLTVVGGFARRMYERTPDDNPNKNYLRIILREVTVLESRVSEIIKIEHEKKG